MANDDRPSHKVKDDGNTKSKKKITSPASISGSADASGLRRSGRETSSRKQTTASPPNTRRSERIEKRTPPSSPPIKKQPQRIEKQIGASPLRRSDRGKKHFSPGPSASKKPVELPASSNIKSKKDKIASSSCKREVDASENSQNEKQDPDVGGRKRKRMTARGYKALFRPQRIRIEAGIGQGAPGKARKVLLDEGLVDLDQVEHVGCPSPTKPLDVKSSESGSADKQIDGKCSSSNRQVSTGNKDFDACADSGDNHISCTSPSSGCKKHDYDETCLACSKEQRINHDFENQQEVESIDKICDRDLHGTSSLKVIGSCEAAGVMENAENNDAATLLRKETSSDSDRVSDGSVCISCKLGGQLRCCDAVGCNRCYHLSCLDPPKDNIPLGIRRCPVCLKNVKSIVPSVSRVVESIWDTREVEVSDVEGLQKQKQYFVKYKGLAHIYNQWVTEAQLLMEAPLLVDNFSKQDLTVKWNNTWTVPHQLLKKRLLVSFEPPNESQENAGKVLSYHYEWFVKWQGLDYGQATWELESASVLGSPKGQKLIKEYENCHGKTKDSAPLVDKSEELSVKLPTVPAGFPLGQDHIHLGYVKKLHDGWTKGESRVVFDNQERAMRIVLFILSLKDVTRPFLIITTSGSLSQWEAMFLHVAPSNDFKVSIEDGGAQKGVRLLDVQKEGGQLVFQVLLYPMDAFVEDLHVLKNINWEAIMVDESQCSEISTNFNHITSLSTDKRLLLFGGPLGESVAEYLNVLSLLGCGDGLSNNIRSKTESDDILEKLKDTLSRYIAYECKSDSSKFVEFWVPVRLSNVQLEQYCATLLSNAMALRSCSKSDTVGALHGILLSNRKCCDHPYIVNPLLQGLIMKDLEPAMVLDVGIKASGKLQLLDMILPEVKIRQLRVLILFQPTGGTGRGLTSVGDILDDFVHQRFGQDSYERVDGVGIVPSKKQAAINNFNKDMSRFIFLLEYRACLPSIKLSSVDIVVIFDSDLNPANDLRALQKISIDSQSEQIMIFRLYSSYTLEEKILRLAGHNVAIDSKLQNLSRNTCDALLMWGASHLFNKLSEFHSANVLNISSEDSFLKEVMEEFLYLISHKCKRKDTAKQIITRVQSCGSYGKTLPLHSETKIRLPDGEQPHMFWRKLLEGRDPQWKFISVSTPRQRKRPNYFEDSSIETSVVDADVGKKRKKTVNNSIEPAASKPVIEGETGGASEGPSGVPAHNGSQSSSGDRFWSTAVGDERSLHHLLKPTVSELCKLLQFSEDVKMTVERFLEYVLENYNVSKGHTNALQALMISLCWIGSSLSIYKIDRRGSFALAKNHLNFSCTEEEANSVYLKLESAKEKFLHDTENQKKPDAVNDCIPAPQVTCTEPIDPRMSHSIPLSPHGVKLESAECQHNQNADVERILLEPRQSENHELSNEETLQSTKRPDKCKRQTENLAGKNLQEIKKFNRVWDERRVHLENDYKVDKALIRTLHSNPSVRSEKLKSLDKEFANKLKEHERMRDVHLKDLKVTQLAADGQMSANCNSWSSEGRANDEHPLHGSQHEDQMVFSGDSKQGAQESPRTALIPSGNLMEVQNHDKAANDLHPTLVVPGDINVTIPNAMVGGSIYTETSVSFEDQDGGSRVNATSFELVGARIEDQPKRGDSSGSTNDVEANDMLFEEGPGATTEEQPNRLDNSSDGANNIESDAVEDHNETAPNDMAVHVDSAGMGVPAAYWHNDNAEDSTIGPDASHAVEDQMVFSGDSKQRAQESLRTALIPSGNLMEVQNHDKAVNDLHPTLIVPADINVTIPNVMVGGSIHNTKTSVSFEDQDGGSRVNATSLELVGARIEDHPKRGDSSGTGTNDVEANDMLLEEGPGAKTGEQPNRLDNLSDGANNIESDAVEDHNETAPNDMAVHVDSAGMGVPAAYWHNENAEGSTIGPDASHAVKDQMVFSGDSKQGAQESSRTALIPSGNLMEVQNHAKSANDLHPTLVVPADINVTIPNVMVGGSIHNETSVSFEDQDGGSRVNATSLELVGARIEDQPKRGDSSGTGTNDVEANDMLFEEGPTEEQPSRLDNSSGDANNIESDAVEDHNGTDPNDMVVHVDSAGMGVPAAYCNIENAEDSTISPDTSHAVKDQMVFSGDSKQRAQESPRTARIPSGNLMEVQNHDKAANDLHPTLVVPADINLTIPNVMVGGSIHTETSVSFEDQDGGSRVNATSLELVGAAIEDQPKRGDCSGTGTNDIEANDMLFEEGPSSTNRLDYSSDGANNIESDAVEDHNETDPNDMAMHVDSAGMGVPAAYWHNENAEDSTISPNTLHAVEDQNDSGGCSSRNSPSAAGSHEITPSVQLFGSPVLDHPVPTNLEIQNEALQLQQLPYSGIQDKEGQANTSSLAEVDVDNLQPVDAGQVGQINSEESLLEPHDDPCFLFSTNSRIAENQSDILPASGLLIETTCEEPTVTCYSGERSQPAENYTDPSNTMLQSRGNLEEHPLVAAESPLGEHRPHVPSSDTVQDQPSVELHNSAQNPEALPLTAEIPNQEASQPELNLFNIQGSGSHNQVASRMPNQTPDPLQAELERLCELKNNFIKFHEDTKLRLKSECEKEIAEMIAQISLKYEAKRKDAEAAFHGKKKELDINLNRVAMNKILAEAFRSKCQDLTPSGHAGTQQVTQAGLMQQLHRFSMLPSMRRSVGVTSTSSGQSSRSQQITPPPPPPPPVQIVHQSAALFSSIPSRSPPNTNHRSPSSTPSRQPPSINPVTPHSMSSRPLSDMNPITPSSTPSRPLPSINPITPSSTPSRPPAGISPIAPSSTPNRPPPSIHQITPSAGNLRVNSDTRAPAPHIQPFRPSGSVSTHDFASHRRLLPSQHVANSLPLTTPTNSQAPAIPPLSTSSLQPLAPPREASSLPPPPPASARTPPSASSWLPSRSQLPRPPPPYASSQSPAPPSLLTHHCAPPSQQHIPSSLPITSSSLPHSSSRTPLPRIPSMPTGQTSGFSASPRPESGGPPLPTPDILSLTALDLLMDINACQRQHNVPPPPPGLNSNLDILDLSEFGREGGAHSSGHDLVCLSDDD